MDTISRIATEIGEQLLQIGIVLLRILITFGVAWGVSKIARQWIEPRLSRQKYGRDGAILIARLITIFAYVVAFVAVMNQLGVEWTGLLTLLSAFTVAIGLSLQDVIKNFFSGILMLLERPFSVGDRVKVRDYEGEIQGIDVRTTLIRNTDGALVYVPNSIMFGEILTNRSHFRTRRLDVTVSDPTRSIDDIQRIVRTSLGELSAVRKPLPDPRIISVSPEGVSLAYSILIQASDDAEHEIMLTFSGALEGATVEVVA
jgi:small conductance mechanosensitive channel